MDETLPLGCLDVPTSLVDLRPPMTRSWPKAGSSRVPLVGQARSLRAPSNAEHVAVSQLASVSKS